jgi:hypothetical protein
MFKIGKKYNINCNKDYYIFRFYPTYITMHNHLFINLNKFLNLKELLFKDERLQEIY